MQRPLGLDTLKAIITLSIFLISINPAYASQCYSKPLHECIGDILKRKLNSTERMQNNEHKEIAAQINEAINLQKNPGISLFEKLPSLSEAYFLSAPKHQLPSNYHNESSDDLLNMSLSMFLYHQSLLKVRPEHSEQLQKSIIDNLSLLPIAQQTEKLINLSLIELFSGETDKALKTIGHAIRNSPDNIKAKLALHLMNESSVYLENLQHTLGFSQASCKSNKEALRISLKETLSEANFRQNELIHSLPDTQLKLRALFLLSVYLQTLNPCQFMHDYYNHQVISWLNNTAVDETYFLTGIALIKSYRRYSLNQ